MTGATTTPAPKPAPLSKSERVYRQLRERILDGTYRTGHRLVLQQMAEEFDVSTVPVREAIRRLEAERLVRYTHNVGAEVAGVDLSQYGDAMETLAIIEAAATGLSAEHLTEAEVAAARALNAQLEALLPMFNPIEFTRLNHEFHRMLCTRCPNQRLLAMVEHEWDRMALIRRSSFLEVPERARESVREHWELLDLIESGASPAEVEAYSRRHKQATKDQFVAHRAATRADGGAAPDMAAS